MRTRLPALTALLFATLCLLLGASPLRADIKLTLELKPGDSISDVAKIVAHAESADNIDKVEFYVDDQLRYTAPSVPYIFSWDTIPDKEGMHTLTATAFDGNGQTKKVSLMVTIDNELALGGDGLAKKANAALVARDSGAAARYARRAMKAEPGNAIASRVMAGIAANEGDWNRAVAILEKSSDLGTSSETMLALATYKMRRAAQPDNAATYFADLDSIYALRQKAADMHAAEVVKSSAADTPASHEAVGDALFNAGHYLEALAEYRRAMGADHAPAAGVSRAALATLFTSSPEAALELLHLAEVNGTMPDRAMRAVRGLALLREVKYDEARAVVASDVAANYAAALAVAAYADTSLGKFPQARAEATAAATALPSSPESLYALSMTTQKPSDQEDALNRTLAAAPFQSAPYLDYAARAAVEKQPDRYDRAMKYLDFVLKREPNNENALLQKALIDLQTNHVKEAGGILDGLAKTGQPTPDVLSALGIYWEAARKPAISIQYTEAARKMDRARFEHSVSPGPMELMFDLNRRYRYRIGFFLTPDTLYPPQAPAGSVTPAAP